MQINPKAPRLTERFLVATTPALAAWIKAKATGRTSNADAIRQILEQVKQQEEKSNV